MNRPFRVFAALAVPLAVAAATVAVRTGGLQRQWAITTGSSPVLECPTEVDAGDHDNGAQVVARFTMKNRGGGVLVIDDVRAACACSGLEQVVDGRTAAVRDLRLAAGEQADLVIRTTAHGAHGKPMRTAVRFRTNDPTRADAGVDVVVPQVRGVFHVTPTDVVFGQVPLGGTARQVIEIRDPGPQPRAVERVSSSEPDRVVVRLLPVPADRNEQGTLVARVEVVAVTDRPAPLDAQVEVVLGGVGPQPAAVRVTGRVPPPVELSPSAVVLPRASAAGPVFESNCVCRSADGTPFKLTAEKPPAGLTIEPIGAAAAPAFTVRVAFQPASAQGRAAGRMVLKFVAEMEGGTRVPLELPVTITEGGQS